MPFTTPAGVAKSYWYGQPGDQSDGSFTKAGPAFTSFVRLTGGAVCNTVPGIVGAPIGDDHSDAGEVHVEISGLTSGKNYKIDIRLVDYGNSFGPSIYNTFTATIYNVGALLKNPGSNPSGLVTNANNTQNLPLGTATPTSDNYSKAWCDQFEWSFTTTAGADPHKVFRWVPSMKISGIDLTTYLRETTHSADIFVTVSEVTPVPVLPLSAPPPPPMPMSSATASISTSVTSNTDSEVGSPSLEQTPEFDTNNADLDETDSIVDIPDSESAVAASVDGLTQSTLSSRIQQAS
ncbi:MAG: hypothetical protein FD138_5 [Planctomycetota bacterium]|nr:MAG: hypothetical protein FD138_5 [Planctomycetota bacterium]